MQRGSRLVELRLMESSFHSNPDQVRLEEAVESERVSLGRREHEKVSQSFSLISPVPSENGGVAVSDFSNSKNKIHPRTKTSIL